MGSTSIDSANDPFSALWALGYTRLVPIVPPLAPVSPESRMGRALARGEGRDVRGKAPGVLGADGLWRGVDHTRVEACESDLAAWRDMGAGVGIRTGRIIAVDIDTLDEPTARRLADMARATLGPAPARIGRFPKTLLVYRTDEAIPYAQVRFRTPAGEGELVEILTEGRYFVAAGTHPSTGRPYRWPGGTPAADDLTHVTAEQVERFLAEVADSVEGATALEAGTGKAPADQDTLRTPSMALLRDAVAAIPNRDRDFASRASWLDVGYALRAAGGPEGEDEALDLWLEWSARWDGGEVDPEQARDEWARMKPPYRRGAPWIFELAERLGGWSRRAEALFDPVEPIGDEDPFRQLDQAPGASATYEILTLDDVLNLPEPTWLIERHLPQGALGFLYGEPGSRKSFLALSMALSIAYGLPDWHGDALATDDETSVLYLAYEGVSGYRQRARAWLESTPLPVGRRPRFALIRHSINFMRADDVMRLIATVRAAGMGKLVLIVVDTVSRAMPGADENLQKDMTIFVAACSALQRETGATVMGVHHSTKSGETMRGSGVLQGAGDFVLRVDKLDARLMGRVTCEKQKDAEDGWSDTYAFAEVDLGTDAKGRAMNSLVPVRVAHGAAGEKVETALTPAVAASILEAMQRAWDEGAPWSKNVRAGERYGVAVLLRDFGIPAKTGEGILETWEGSGHIVWELRDRHKKLMGLRPKPQAGADDEDDEGGEGVFG